MGDTDHDLSDVSADNPCPFLRALVAQGLLPDGNAPIGKVTETILTVAKTGEGSPKLPSIPIRAIALIAYGLGPLQIARNGLGGLQPDGLRNGATLVLQTFGGCLRSANYQSEWLSNSESFESQIVSLAMGFSSNRPLAPPNQRDMASQTDASQTD